MSWDILIINSSKPVDFEKDDWPNFNPRQSVIDNIQKTFPDSNWQNLSWGLLTDEKAVIEFNMGDKEDMDNTFMLHIGGGQDATAEVAKMCSEHNWIAFDISGDKFIDNADPSADGFNEWEKYKNQVVTGEKIKKAWWKIW